MFTIEELEDKVKNFAQQVEQSAANHNMLVGAKLAYDGLLNDLKAKAASNVNPVLGAVESLAIDAVEAAVAPEAPASEPVQ